MKIIDFNVGDCLKLMREVHPHGVVGDLFTVVRVIDRETAEMDRCGCPVSLGHQNTKIWGVYADFFVKVTKSFTAEEIAMAKALPSPDDAAKFFKRD